MDDMYVDWRSHLLANHAGNDGPSLLKLLDSIPTDIPRDASEFDEEIRNLIISLYSDTRESDQLYAEGEKEESSRSIKIFGDKSLDKSNIDADFGKLGLKELAKIHDINSSQIQYKTEGSPERLKEQCNETQNALEEATSLSSIYHNEGEAFEKKDMNLFPCDDFNGGSKSNASLLMQYNQNELKISHDKDTGGLSNEIIKKCHLKDSIETHIGSRSELVSSGEEPLSTKQENAGLEFETNVTGLTTFELQQQNSVKSQNEDYQQNLDDLGDAKAATILSSVTGWLSRLSSDPSKDLLGSVSLLEDLPSEAVLDRNGNDRASGVENIDQLNHGMGIFRYEVEDQCSVVSEISKLDKIMEQHPLGVIEEENDSFFYEAAGHRLLDSHSDMSLSESLDYPDSGLGSLSALNPINGVQSTLEGNGPETRSAVSDGSILGTFEPSLSHSELGSQDKQVEVGHNVDTVMAQLEQKLESIGKYEKKNGEGPVLRPFSDVEQLTADYSTLLQEKMALKRQIWDLEENLSVEKKMTEVSISEKSDILNQKAEIEAAVLELEDKVKGIEVECKTRDEKLKEVVEKLNDTNKCYEKLREKSQETEKELQSKGNELAKTKTELNGYIAACSSANDSREKCELQLKLLSDAFQKMKHGKDWLEFQLKTLSDSRAKMQLEFEESKAEQNDKTSAILELQAENKNLTAKLVEVKFANGKEKNEILKGMEKVEEQILEHRACFAELEKENENLLLLLKERDRIINADEIKIKELINIVADAETKVKELIAEIHEKEGLLNSLKQDFSAVKAKMDECEELVRIKEEEKVSLLSKTAELDSRIVALGGKVEAKESDLLRIVEEKATLEKQLEAANDERVEFERAASSLKNDMQKVNLIFEVMKKDLASKSSMLLAIDQKKQKLVLEMKDLHDYMSDQSQLQDELRATLKEKVNLIEVLSSEKEELAKEIRPLRERCLSLQTGLNDSIKAKEAIELDANNAKSAWMAEETRLQKEISTLKQDHDTLVAENTEKEHSLVAMKEECNIVCDDLKRLKKESQMEIAGLRAKENKLQAKLKERQKEWLQKEENYESSILSLVDKLKQESIAKQTVDKMVTEQSELMRKKSCEQQMIFAKIKEVFRCFTTLKGEKDAIERELCQFKDSSSKLYSFLVSIVNRMCKQIEERTVSNETLVGEIEELKGELSKSAKSAEVLRSQMQSERKRGNEYENQVEKKEAEIRNLKKQIIVLKKEKDTGLMKFGQYKKKAEGKFVENENVILNYRKEIENLKNENSMVLEKCLGMEEHLSKLKNETKEKDLMISELSTSVSQCSTAEKAEQQEKTMLTAAYNELQGVIFSLENQLGIERSQTKVLEDQVRNLKWQCKQAKSDAQTKKEELEVLTSQHEKEVQNIASLLSVTKTEVGCLRDENSEIRREKQKCNGQLIESRERLRRQRIDLEKLQNEVRKRNGELIRLKEDMKDCKSAATREMLDYIVKKAVINISDTEEKEKGKYRRELVALQTLRKCMLGLRNEMDSLHSEMSSQMDYLQGSKCKIKEFQDNLGDLQTVCKSLHEKSSNSRPVEDT